MLPQWTENYVGIQYQEHGRDLDGGLDCWGLVRLVLEKEAGIKTPLLKHIQYTRGCDRRALVKAIEEYDTVAINWKRLKPNDPPQCFDVIWLRNGGPIHFGVVVAPGWMLHVEEGSDSCLERFDGLSWKNRIMGVFRHG